jgi:hypothetical protein
MLVSNWVRGSTIGVLLALGAAACSESPMAPVSLSPDASEPLMARGGDADSDSDSDSDHYENNDRLKSGRRTFTIRPGKAVRKKLGDHVLRIPANVVCDPATSGYGPSYWDASCRPIDRRIKVTAKWATLNGQAVIFFTTNLRFVPTNDRSRWVILEAKHSKNVDPAANFAILWYNPETLKWVDESESDPTLRASFDRRERVISRRLKHFSTYRVWSGRGSYNVTSGMDDGLDGFGGNW